MKAKKSIFILGDSISIQYGPYLREYLAGRVDCFAKSGYEQAVADLDIPAGANGGDSGNVLAYLVHDYLKNGPICDYMLLNCGLHDIKTDPASGARQQTAGKYKENLVKIFTALRDKGIKVIWVRTTPADAEVHNTPGKAFFRFGPDVPVYNCIADGIVADFGLPVVDLWNFTRGFGRAAFCDHVHYHEEIRKLQAAHIAGAVLNIIR